MRLGSDHLDGTTPQIEAALADRRKTRNREEVSGLDPPDQPGRLGALLGAIEGHAEGYEAVDG